MKFNIPRDSRPPFKVRVVCKRCDSDEVIEYIASARDFIERIKDEFDCLYCNRTCAKAEILDK